MGDATPPAQHGEDAIPVRMLSEYAYCARLFHFMHVEGLWADNAYTVEGRHTHRRVDKLDHVLPDPSADDDGDEPEGDAPPDIARSVHLGSERLGLVGKLDLVSVAGSEAVPVETKRGKTPNNAERSWEPERVQLMAQGLLLREHGFRTDHGVLYFAGSRQRVTVPFSRQLEERTLTLISRAREAIGVTTIPPPLVDSPKCRGCSLNGICLPDETHALEEVPPDPAQPQVRRLYPSRTDATPLYVQEPGACLRKKARHLVVELKGETLATAKLKDVSQVVLCGRVRITTPTIHLLMEADIPIVHVSGGHWFHGITAGFGLRNAYARAAQFRAADDTQRSLALAREFVCTKISNQRTLLRRNAQPSPKDALAAMKDACDRAARAETAASLLGHEGTAARSYFGRFATMLRPPDGGMAFAMDGRNARPPRDPVNAMLSFAYAVLSKECAVALATVGLDPHWGFFHRPRHGRPALALDLMEEFRPLVADSAVITAINTGMVTHRNFTSGPNGCFLGPKGRKGLLRAYEARLDQLVTHPVFDYRCSWRQVIRLQAQLLERHLRGDVPCYTGLTTR